MKSLLKFVETAEFLQVLADTLEKGGMVEIELVQR